MTGTTKVTTNTHNDGSQSTVVEEWEGDDEANKRVTYIVMAYRVVGYGVMAVVEVFCVRFFFSFRGGWCVIRGCVAGARSGRFGACFSFCSVLTQPFVVLLAPS